MAKFIILLAIFALCVAAVQSAGSCPLSSQVQTCTPKCTNDLECSSIGGSCCPNICNTKSCSRPKSGSSGTDKYSSNTGSGSYCGNVKCNSFEKCGLDASKREKCVRN